MKINQIIIERRVSEEEIDDPVFKFHSQPEQIAKGERIEKAWNDPQQLRSMGIIPPQDIERDYQAMLAREKEQDAKLMRPTTPVQKYNPKGVPIKERDVSEAHSPAQQAAIAIAKKKKQQGMAEAFDQPYSTDLEKSEHDDYDALVQLPDGSYLSIMFNKEGEGKYQVEFWRGPSQGVTGEGDSQRIFATVLNAIQRFIKEHKPQQLTFGATKDVEPGQKRESRAKLYNRLVHRYAAAWGYNAIINDYGNGFSYTLTRLEEGVAEGSVTPDVNVNKIYDDGNTKEWHIYRGKEMIGYVWKNLPDTAEGLYIASGHGPGRGFTEEFTGLKSAVDFIASLDNQGVAEGSEQQYLWHGSRQKIPMLEPRQSVDTGGAAGSNQNAIYATSDPKVAIAMGLTTPGSDTGMFPNDPQMVLFSGKIRKGENVYLHKVPMNGPDGKPQFVQGGNSREFHSVPGVKGIKPTEIKAVPVDKYLNLIRQATPQDLELRKKYMKQGVAEGQESASVNLDINDKEGLILDLALNNRVDDYLKLFANIAGKELLGHLPDEAQDDAYRYAHKLDDLGMEMLSNWRNQQNPRIKQEISNLGDQWYSLFKQAYDYFVNIGNQLGQEQSVAEGETWSKHNNPRAGGMSKKSVASYRRSHPGSKIQTAVTTKPSKLKKGSKAAKRRKSFCARMRGMKKHRTSAKTARDPNSNINKSLRRWNCESVEQMHELVMLAEQFLAKHKK